MRRSTGTYPANWKAISQATREAANWRCVRCQAPHQARAGYSLTIHHLDLNPSNNAWWNLAPLCCKCHLRIQSKVVMERVWMLEHSAWFKPYVAGYYAAQYGLNTDREWVEANTDHLITLGQGLIELEAA